MKVSRSQSGSIKIDFEPNEADNAIATLKILYCKLESEEVKQVLSEVIASLEYDLGVHYNS